MARHEPGVVPIDVPALVRECRDITAGGLRGQGWGRGVRPLVLGLPRGPEPGLVLVLSE